MVSKKVRRVLVRRVLASLAVAVCLCNSACAWLLSDGDRWQRRTAPLQIANMGRAPICAVTVWTDNAGGSHMVPEHNILFEALSTPMGTETRLMPMQPGESRYFDLIAPATYHAKVTPCGGPQQDAPDFVLATRAGYRWILN